MPLTGIVDGGDDRREVVRQAAVERAPGDRERLARGQPRLEVRAHREAHERRLGERLAAVAGDVAEQQPDAPVGQRERVVEVTAGGGAVGGAVGDRRQQRAEARGHGGQQRRLQQADVLHQALALALEAARAGGRDDRVDAEREDEQAEHRERVLRPRDEHLADG